MELFGKRLRDYVEGWSLFFTFQYFKLRDLVYPASRLPKIIETDVHDFTMKLDTSLFFDWYISKFAYFYEANEIVWVQNELDPGDVFLDIGCNIGLYSLFAARAVSPTGTVLAIDADAGIMDRLHHNLQVNGFPNVRVLNIGISDTNEPAAFMIPVGPMRAAASLIDDVKGDPVMVQCHPLLDVLKNEGITQVRGVKLDIEGMEYRVLSQFLHDAPQELWPDWIITEYFPRRDKASGGNVLKMLEKFGYILHKRHALNCIFSRTEINDLPLPGTETKGKSRQK
jgi:FkbM family methyltransferase